MRGAAAATAEEGMAFRPKPEFLVVSELEQLMRICPSAESFRLVR